MKNLPTIINCLVTAKEYTDPSEWSIVPRRPNEPVASHMWTTLWEPLKSFSYKIRQDPHCNDEGMTDETSKAQLWFLFPLKQIKIEFKTDGKSINAQQTTKLTLLMLWIYAREDETSIFSSWKQILQQIKERFLRFRGMPMVYIPRYHSQKGFSADFFACVSIIGYTISNRTK